MPSNSPSSSPSGGLAQESAKEILKKYREGGAETEEQGILAQRERMIKVLEEWERKQGLQRIRGQIDVKARGGTGQPRQDILPDEPTIVR